MDVQDRQRWVDLQGQRQQLAASLRRTVALEQARYYAALAACAQDANFQLVLEHWCQVLWLLPDYKQVTTPEQVARLFWKQAFLSEILAEIRQARETGARYAAEAAAL